MLSCDAEQRFEGASVAFSERVEVFWRPAGHSVVGDSFTVIPTGYTSI